MIALIQRVTNAEVVVNHRVIAQINQGILAFIGIEKGDQTSNVDRLLERLLGYRLFADENDKMNLSVKDIHGGLLLVPQFTLAADTRKGKRPSFSSAASHSIGEELFTYFINQAKAAYPNIATGEFAAEMQVSLCNDGPVTFWLTG